MRLYFYNHGTLDIRAVKTFGLNAKVTDSPIGYFGTGLKYAIASILREGGSISIATGNPDEEGNVPGYMAQETYDFTLEDDSFRGKSFKSIHMNGEALPFTTELGKNWKPWMMFRELYCNALDEGGSVTDDLEYFGSDTGGDHTIIEVNFDQFADVYSSMGEYFLSKDTPRVIQTETSKLFYKGILVHEGTKSFINQYNIASGLDLTEDRTANDTYALSREIANLIVASKDTRLIYKTITAPTRFRESGLPLNWADSGRISREFLDTVGNALRNKEDRVNPTAKSIYEIRRPNAFKRYPIRPNELTSLEAKMLKKAKNFIDGMGELGEYNIQVFETLGDEVMAKACRDTLSIQLSRVLFTKGTKYLASTLLEESFHLKHGYDDETYVFQTFLLDYIITQQEQINGDPL